MNKKLILGLSSMVLMAAAVFTTLETTSKTPESDLLTRNIEALSRQEPGSGACFYNFDTPAWFVDDEYKLVCKDPQTQTPCVVLKGHDFSNPSTCS